MGNIGIINEQGYPAGQFGFTALNEEDKKAIDKADKEKETKKEEEK